LIYSDDAQPHLGERSLLESGRQPAYFLQVTRTRR
jgi:hypothetical protein